MQILSQQYLALGVMDISTESEHHENENISGFREVKIKRYDFHVNPNVTTELLGDPIFELQMRWARRPHQTPIGMFRGFSIEIDSLGIGCRNCIFVEYS